MKVIMIGVTKRHKGMANKIYFQEAKGEAGPSQLHVTALLHRGPQAALHHRRGLHRDKKEMSFVFDN